ncbi:hypothetical protein [Mycobacterium sp. shizuoka-1]|uniref:hypothetical protein n=1 Tax=Mycobacterium sp. shizuoka-1 TaxID=2039281 RepID=UPI001157F633|nr:hypothetical protein [Mycobacterium sp. shizuoka-1]
MPKKKSISIYDRDGNLDIELYCIKTTRASKVPFKIENPTVLRRVARAVNDLSSSKQFCTIISSGTMINHVGALTI